MLVPQRSIGRASLPCAIASAEGREFPWFGTERRAAVYAGWFGREQVCVVILGLRVMYALRPAAGTSVSVRH
jgi:hypothetical protein